MKKVKYPEDAIKLEQIPNVGPRIAEDLRFLGIDKPQKLKLADPYMLYVQLCRKTKKYHDPCVLDTFIAAVFFMKGNGVRSWWNFTKDRKKTFHKIENQIRGVKK